MGGGGGRWLAISSHKLCNLHRSWLVYINTYTKEHACMYSLVRFLSKLSAPYWGNLWLVQWGILHCSLWLVQTINFLDTGGLGDLKGSEIGSIAQYTIIAQAWSVQLYGDLYKSALMSNGGWFGYTLHIPATWSVRPQGLYPRHYTPHWARLSQATHGV